MKKLVVIAALSLSGLAAFGQGLINFGSSFSGSFVMPIFGPDPANPLLALSGVPSTSRVSGVVPNSGTTIYGGPLLQGSGYTLQFWAGSTSANLQPVYTTTFRTATADKLPAGLISGNVTTPIPGVDAGQQAFYQVRVWDNKGGSASTWAAGSGANGTYGSSAIVLSGALGGVDTTGGVHPLNPNSTDWVSFNLISNVPEPTSLALAGLGAAAMMIFRRRK